MSTHLCFRTLSIGYGVDEKPYVTGAPCIGSRCAAWTNAQIDPGKGYCGLAHASQLFADPARPTTRQTTRKEKPDGAGHV